MHFLPADLEAYIGAHTTPESGLLARLDRETHVKVHLPRMLSGHAQGRTLALLSRLMRPQRVLEVGTYTGYSALCLAEGLAPGGTLVTIDRNDELAAMARRYFAEAGLTDQIDYRLGEARTLLPQLPGPFDLVFLDADKENYVFYYETLLPRMQPGSLLIADNVLWSGKVISPEADDKDTVALRAFNAHVQADPRVENVLLPLRDGLMLARIR